MSLVRATVVKCQASPVAGANFEATVVYAQKVKWFDRNLLALGGTLDEARNEVVKKVRKTIWTDDWLSQGQRIDLELV